MRNAVFTLMVLLLAPAVTLAGLTTDQIRQDYDFFWKTYEDAYVFWQLKAQDYGVDRDTLKAEYAPTLAQCKTKADLMRLITEIQTRLHDGHLQNEAMISLGPIALLRGIGFIDTAGHKIHVLGVAPGSQADQAGIEKGDELLVFAGTPVATIARRARTLIGASSEGQFWNMLARMMHVYNPLLGQAPEKCVCKFRKPSGEIVDTEFDWAYYDPQGGKAGPSLDEMIDVDSEGPLPIKAFIYKDLNIGYMKVESFMKTEYPKDQLDKIFTAFKDTDALVVDFRNNGGGVGPWGVLLANYFIEQGPEASYMERLYSKTFFRMVLSQAPAQQVEALFKSPRLMRMIFKKLGIDISAEEMESHFVDGEYQPFYHTSRFRDMMPYDLEPGVPVYTKPVYVITNGGCFSTTDICIKLLSEFGRVTIVGTPEGAGSGSPIPVHLPNSGVKVMVCHARAYPPSGEMIEGRPVQPDVIVETTQEDLVQGVDRPLVTAIELAARDLGLIDGPSRAGTESFTQEQLETSLVADNTASNVPAELSALVPPSVREAHVNRKFVSKLMEEIEERSEGH